MASVIEVMFSVVATVDCEYPPDQHAADIISVANSIFSSATVNVVGVQVLKKGMEAAVIRTDQRRTLKPKQKPRVKD